MNEDRVIKGMILITIVIVILMALDGCGGTRTTKQGVIREKLYKPSETDTSIDANGDAHHSYTSEKFILLVDDTSPEVFEVAVEKTLWARAQRGQLVTYVEVTGRLTGWKWGRNAVNLAPLTAERIDQ